MASQKSLSHWHFPPFEEFCRAALGCANVIWPLAKFLPDLLLLPALQMQVHRLQRDFSGPSKPIPEDLSAATKETRGESLKNRLHLNCAVLINPAARFDVDLFSCRQGDFKHVSIFVQPKNSLGFGTRERINDRLAREPARRERTGAGSWCVSNCTIQNRNRAPTFVSSDHATVVPYGSMLNEAYGLKNGVNIKPGRVSAFVSNCRTQS